MRRTGTAFPTAPVLVPNPARLLAVDPGSVHCGMAWFDVDRSGWGCYETRKVGPVECLEAVQEWCSSRPGVLVVEEFRLYPWALQQQGFSALGVVEVIGALRWVHFERFRTTVQLEMQGAFVKERGERYMALHGIEHQGTNQHMRDAEAHGWYRIGQLTGREGP